MVMKRGQVLDAQITILQRHALDCGRRVLFGGQSATLSHCEDVGVFVRDPLEKSLSLDLSICLSAA